LTPNRDTLSNQIPTPELTQTLQRAVALMRPQNKSILTAEMVLWAFLQSPTCEAHAVLQRLSRELGFDWLDFQREVERFARDRRTERDIKFDFVTDRQERVPLSNEMLIILDEGLALADMQHQSKCSTIHALAMMTGDNIGTAWLLKRRGITRQKILGERESRPPKADLAKAVQPSPSPSSKPKPKATATTVYAREKLVKELVNLLSIMQGRHVILVGATGVGKRSLVLAVARLIGEGKGPTGLKSVKEIDETALLNDPLAEIKDGLSSAKGGILFVADVARFFGGIHADFSDKACLELQKAFLANDIIIIGTATEARYQERLSKSNLLMENSQILRVPPATIEETKAILGVLRPQFQADYGITIAEESLDTVTRLVARYYTVEPLPGAAVYLLHRACALLKTNQKKADNSLNPEDVMVAVSLLTDVPMAHMGADERNRYLNMVERLHQRIVGQDEAVVALSRAVKMARVGLKEPKRPIGSFLFLGPTGVGKTELAKALAEFLFGTENALIVLDMSEYMEDNSINRFVGSPPGYVGYEAGGQLTDAVKKRPYSVVLFDEVEKASVKVFDALLQVMEEGRLTSGRGETVDFSQTVILMTSNIGGRYLVNLELAEEAARQLTQLALQEHFRPEFLNRLDDIIYFQPLSDENLKNIFNLLLIQEGKLMANHHLQLKVTPEATDWLLAQNDHPEWGARPLRRLIQKHIREPMADYILEKDPPAGTSIEVKLEGEKLAFEVSK